MLVSQNETLLTFHLFNTSPCFYTYNYILSYYCALESVVTNMNLMGKELELEPGRASVAAQHLSSLRIFFNIFTSYKLFYIFFIAF